MQGFEPLESPTTRSQTLAALPRFLRHRRAETTLAHPRGHSLERVQSQSRSRHRRRGRDLLLRRALPARLRRQGAARWFGNSKGRTWFYANWGYEESKHSLVLSDWLLRSGHRSEEYMADLEKKVFEREWNLPHDSALGMLAYAMVQEHATFINYRNLRQRVQAKGGDPALENILSLVTVDEAAHYGLFKSFFELFMKLDRDAAMAALRPVLNQFQMPAIHDLLDENAKRIARIRELEIFNEEIFFRDVYTHFLKVLEITKSELRGPKVKKSLAT